MEINGTTKNAHKNFNCDICDYTCSFKRDWNRHILSAKHQNWANGNNLELKMPKNDHLQKSYHSCNCGKKYITQSGLWKHQKKCDGNLKFDLTNNDNVTSMLFEVIKSNQELQKQMFEVCKTVQSTNNINTINQNNIQHTNSHNKTFNLQFFLNETCKDAMNISEFIDNIKLQLCDLENIGKLGYVEGISKIIIKNLNALDVEKRPVHCSDIKREIMYVKDEDTWEKESDEKQKIKEVISSVVSKNLKLLPEFQKKYPQCMNSESKKSDEYNQIIMETMGGGIGCGEKNKEKIIRKIAKEVTIDKN
jgi:hypothetical protein